MRVSKTRECGIAGRAGDFRDERLRAGGGEGHSDVQHYRGFLVVRSGILG